jgi:hypothetical protein
VGLRERLRKLGEPKHSCDVPTGVIYEPTWTCPTCEEKWVFLGHANYSVWVNEGKG